MPPVFRAAVIGLLTLLTTACATPSRVTSVWTDPGAQPTQYRTLVVFGVASKTKVRRAYEDNFTTALTAAGVSARPSHTLVSEKSLRRTAQIKRALSGADADALIVTHLIPEAAQSAEPAARATSIPDTYRRFDRYYSQVYSDVARPDYYTGYQSLRLETNLYDAQRETLVWSGRSQPLDPNSEQTISQVIADVIAQLRRDGLLAGAVATKASSSPLD